MDKQKNKKRTPQTPPSTLDKFVSDVCDCFKGTDDEHSNGYLHGFMNRIDKIEAKRRKKETETEE